MTSDNECAQKVVCACVMGGVGWEVRRTGAGAGAMNPPAPRQAAARSGYHQKALAQIRNSLLPFANNGNSEPPGSSAASTVSSGVSSGFSSSSGNGLDKDLTALPQTLNQLIALGFDEVSVCYVQNFCIWYL